MPKIRLSDSLPSSENASSPDGEPLAESQVPPRQTRREIPGNWLAAYSEYTAESESPESFHLWTGLSVLASAVRRNCWLNQGIYDLFPNLYVVLTGPAGEVAKSTTIRLGRALLYGLPEIKFGPDSVTTEELIRQFEMAGKENLIAAMTLHSTELSDLIDPSGIKMVSFLTTIYDGDVKWNRSTKGSGANFLKKPVLNLLGGTTPEWIATGMPVSAIGHGFTSRVIFVYEDKPRFDNPFPGEPNHALVKALINDLQHIALLKGEFVWSAGSGKQPVDAEGVLAWTPEYRGEAGFEPSAQSVYQWYYKLIRKSKPPDYRLKTYYARKRNHLLKVAMLLSVSESDDLVLRPRDIHTAWGILEGTEKKMVRAFSAVGKYEHASDLERILHDIQETGGMREEEVYELNYAAGDQQQIYRIIQMLVSMKKVMRTKEADGSWFRPYKRGGG